MSRIIMQAVLVLVLAHAHLSSAALSNQFHHFGIKPDDTVVSHRRVSLPLHSQVNASASIAQIAESSLKVELQGAGLDSEHIVVAVMSLLALLAPALIIVMFLLVISVRMGLQRIRGDAQQQQVAEKTEEESLEPLKQWRDRHAPAPLAPVRFAIKLIVIGVFMYGGLEWMHFVASGPFARRFVCTDTTLDAPSADLTPMVRETLRGFCWEGYRWVGVNRGEAELLLLGLEQALIQTTASGVKGEVVELGAALGETTLWVSRFLDLYSKATGEERRGHRVYDAFEGAGFPPCNGQKDGITCKRWWMRSDIFRHTLNFFLADRRWLLRFLLRSQSATQPDLIQKGYFSNNPPEVYPDHVAFAMFDSDMYESILDSFNQVYPKVSNPGGLTFTHDVDRSCCAGPRVAASQYLAKHSQEPMGFYTWEGQRPFVTWAAAGPSLCKAGECKAPPGEGWKWNAADEKTALVK